MGIRFNFEKGSLDFLKNVRKRDIFFVFISIIIVYGLFQNKIDRGFLYVREKVFDEKKEPKIVKVKRSIFDEGIEDEVELKYILQDIVEKYNCTYVNVNLFHNGDTTRSGYHFKKMSCVSEGRRQGKLPIIHRLRNWVIEPFAFKFAVLKKESTLYMADLKNDKDAYFNTTLPRLGCHSVFYVAIYDHRFKDHKGNSHFIGYLSFQWDKPTNFKEKTLVSMKQEETRIREFVIK